MISTGYYDAQWRKYEAGGGLTVQTLLKIALALDVSLGALLQDLTNWPLKSVAEIQQQGAKTDAIPRRRVTDWIGDSPDNVPDSPAEVVSKKGSGPQGKNPPKRQ